MAEQRYQAVLAVISDGLSVSQVAQKVGVSRQTLHSWLARYEASGLKGRVDRSHRPVSAVWSRLRARKALRRNGSATPYVGHCTYTTRSRQTSHHRCRRGRRGNTSGTVPRLRRFSRMPAGRGAYSIPGPRLCVR